VSVVHDRFQVCDPKLGELVETFPARGEAVRCAWREAAARGYYMEVFDVMAHRDAPRLWRVLTAGNVVLAARRVA
jgi:hypothetical protein